jgi:hypothetical protein
VRVQPDVISGPLNEYNYSVDADDRVAVFARSEADFAKAKIMVSWRVKGSWTKPQKIGFFDERYRDSDPWLTPDGRTLYFVSDRPTPSRPDKRDLDVWRSVRLGGVWQAPEHLGDAVNGRGEELGPEVHDGRLYFATARRTGKGGLDIYVAEPMGAGFGSPVLLPEPINSAASESDFTLSSDGKTAMFWRMVDGKGLIHVTRRTDAGWTSPEPLGPEVNRGSFNFTPALSGDGTRLTFGSNVERPGQREGMSDVYQLSLAPAAARPDPAR